MRGVFFATILAASMAAVAGSASAQNFPDHVVKLVVPQPPGGGFDAVGRIAADKLSQVLGQSVVVENKTGAGTRAGTDAVAKAAPDGYTLLVGATPNIVFNPVLYKDLPHDPVKDFTPVGLLALFNYTLVSRADLPQKTLKDIVAFAKANPGKLSYASGGIGTGQHILMAALSHLAGIQTLHVPYRGAQAAYQDVIAGRVDLFFDNATTARPLVEAGKVRAVAVSSDKRLPFHPDVPTVKETGVAPLELMTWFGVFAPSKTPPAVLGKLRDAMKKVGDDAQVKERFAKMGAAPINPSPEEMQRMVANDAATWRKILTEAKIAGN